jgi:hypothetical protein
MQDRQCRLPMTASPDGMPQEEATACLSGLDSKKALVLCSTGALDRCFIREFVGAAPYFYACPALPASE